MKKISVLIFLCLIFFVQLVYAENIVGDLGEKIKGIEEAKENIEESVEKIKETKWDYLGEKWKNLLLKNSFVSFVDSFFQKINFVFVILFGENYSLSLTLFFIIILWFYMLTFFFKFSEILAGYSTFSPAILTAIGFGFLIILAQLKFLRSVVEFFGWLVFSQKVWWVQLIIFAIIVFVLFFLYKLSSQIGQSVKEYSEKSKEELAKIEEKTHRGIIKSFADAIVKGLK